MNRLIGVGLFFIHLYSYSMSFEEAQRVYHKVCKVNGFKNYPKIYLSPSNLVTAGLAKTNSYIIVTQGMLDTVTKDEMAWVLLHELYHFKSNTGGTWKSEMEADRWAADNLAKSGYDKCKGVKLSVIFPADEQHPPGAYRYNQLKCTR